MTLTVALLTLAPWAIGKKLETVLYVAMLFNKAQGLYYKTLRIHNLREMDRFGSKLVSYVLDKHANLSKQTN